MLQLWQRSAGEGLLLEAIDSNHLNGAYVEEKKSIALQNNATLTTQEMLVS